MLRQRRVGLHGRGIDPDALALDQTRLGDQSQNPVEDRRAPHGAGARGSVTARNGPAHDPGFPAVETPVATGNPSSAIPARAQSRCPRSSPPSACGNSAQAAPKAPPAWPRNRTDRPPRQSRRNRPRSVPTADGRKTHDPASAASPPSLPSSPPDDPSAVPSSSANPPVKSERQRIRPGRLCPVPTSSTGCYRKMSNCAP